MKTWKYLIALPFLLGACIGTDVLEIEIVPEEIRITSKADTIKVGESFQFNAIFFNNEGERDEPPLLWQTLDSTIITVDADGLATAISAGMTHVVVQAGLVADSVAVTAGAVTVSNTPAIRSGEFIGVNNYSVSGNFQMEVVNGSSVQLSFAENFRASSGPGLYVYLTNNLNSVSGGIELGKLDSNSGAQSYQLDNIDLFNAYEHVLIYCKPFGVAFGRGTFNN